MAIYKNKDIEVNVNQKSAEVGYIDTNFYTEDKSTSSIRITIKNNKRAVDLSKTNLTPKLDLFHSDGSIFMDEPLNIIYAENGLVQYKISDNVIKHVGKVNAKLFLKSDTQSVHVADFNFNIKDSGVTDAVGKEIHVDILDDKVKKVLVENVETFRADANETAEYLKPTVVDTTLKKFNELSTAKQVDSEVILARAGKDNLNDRITIINDGIGVNILDFPRLENEHDDRNRFQRAIDYLESIGGGKLVIPKTKQPYEMIATNNPTVSNPYRVEIRTSNIEIEGVGLPVILMKGITHNYLDGINDISSSGRDVFTVFSFIGSENCKVSGIKIIGEWDGIGEFRFQSPRAKGIGFLGTKNCHVDGVIGENILGNVVNFTNSTVGSEGFYKWSENISIINSYAYQCLENGFNYMGGTRDGKFINNHCIKNGSSGFEAATENLVVSDNISKENKYSGLSVSGNNYLISNNVVTGNSSKNEFINKKTHGIHLTGGNNGEIINNRVSNSEGYEICIYPGVSSIRVKNNTLIHDNTSEAENILYIAGSMDKKIKDIDISGNKIINTSTSLLQSIVCNYVENGVITNNIILSDYGPRSVYIQSTCKNITLDSNVVNKEINLSSSGIDLVSRDNLGENLVNRVEMSNEPISGKWEKGDIIDNVSKSIGLGQPDRWRCITGGYANKTSWSSNTSYTTNQLVNSNNKVYRCVSGGTSGTYPPAHVTGIESDSNIEWEYVGVLAKFEVSGQIGLYQSSTTTPLFKGQLSQSGNKIFIAIGTNSPSDWIQLSNN